MAFISLPKINLGNIVSTITKGIQQVAAPVLNQAKGMLQDLLKSGFDGLGKLATQLTSALPSPFGKLADKLLGKGVTELQGLVQGAVEKALDKLLGQLQPRQVAGTPAGTTVTPPTLDNRMQQIAQGGGDFQALMNQFSQMFPQFAGQIQQMTGAPAPAPTTGAATGAATTTAPTTTASGPVPPGLAGEYAAAFPFNADGLTPKQQADIAEMQKAGMDPSQIAMQKMMMKAQNQQMMAQFFNQMNQMIKEGKDKIIQNFR